MMNDPVNQNAAFLGECLYFLWMCGFSACIVIMTVTLLKIESKMRSGR